MLLLVTGIIVFIGIHSASVVALPLRDRLAAKNELAWKGFYSLVSLVGIVLICIGYGEARLEPVVLYSTPAWMRHVAGLLMLPFFVFFLASLFPGRISRAVKHPLLISAKTWALSHLLVNGTLADVLLFGSFLAWAVMVRISLKSREPRKIPTAPETAMNDAIALLGGLGLYAGTVLWWHESLIGVATFVR